MTQTRKEIGPDRRSLLAGTAGLLGVVFLYVWDDLIFAAPIVGSVSIIGMVPTFLVFAVLFAGVNFVGAMLAVRAYDRWSRGQPSRLEGWLSRQAASRRGRWASGMVSGGKVVGFVASSFLLGGIVTTWIIRYSGRRDQIHLLALASSVIFAVTFVGLYAGIGRLIVDGIFH